MENIPTISDIKAIKPEIDSLKYVDSGGFKAVFVGNIKGNPEAIKLIYIPSDNSGDEEMSRHRDEIVARVKREFETLGQCRTDRLVKLGSIPLELLAINQYDYLIYSEEFVEGESLKSRIAKNSQPEFVSLRKLTICLMEALCDIQGLNLIHRDIKPGNIMVTNVSKRPFVLLDLGIAFKLGGTDITAQKAGPPGTLVYMAPELLRPDYKNVLDIRSDLYSAGVTIFEYAAGKHPFLQSGEDLFTTLDRIRYQQPEQLSKVRPDLPERFCLMINRCMKKLPALRFSNPATVLRELEEIL
jgi:serine/threonine-protein kinase